MLEATVNWKGYVLPAANWTHITLSEVLPHYSVISSDSISIYPLKKKKKSLKTLTASGISVCHMHHYASVMMVLLWQTETNDTKRSITYF